MSMSRVITVSIIASVLFIFMIIRIILEFYSVNHKTTIRRPNRVFLEARSLPKDKICPFCGECKDHRKTLTLSGVLYAKKTWYKGIFRTRKCSKDIFECYTCKAKWQENYTSEVINTKGNNNG